MIIFSNVGDVSRSFNTFVKLIKFFYRFFTAVGALQVNIWFQSSLGSLQTGQVCVSCSFLSNFVFSNPHELQSIFVSICR